MMELRPYQREAIDAMVAEWSGGNNRTVIHLPTGGGKTVIFAHAIRERMAQNGNRSLVLVHREELATQARKKICDVNPGLSVGIVKAGMNQTGADVIVASVPTLARMRRREQIRGVGLVVADECHHAAAPTWRTVLEHFGSFNGLPTAGFTATLSRNDKLDLSEIWQSVSYSIGIADLIRAGYLVPVRGKRIHVEGLDLAHVKVSAGDLQAGALGEMLLDADSGRTIAKALLEHAPKRQTVVFSPTVRTAYDYAEHIREAGLSCEVVEGDTSTDEREAIYKRYETGVTRVLSTCMVLTEGWDAPWCSCAVIARATKSPGLYVQMVGRILRLWEGKTDALVLDVVGASAYNKLATLADLTPKRRRDADNDDDVISYSDDDEYGEPSPIEEDIPDHDGIIVSTDVDLFGDSPSVWLRTSGPLGVRFLPPVDGHLLFLWPQGNGMHAIGVKPMVEGVRSRIIKDGMPLDFAIQLSEEMYRNTGDDAIALGVKVAPWRSDRPSAAQLHYARSWKLRGWQRMDRGQLADAITVHKVTRLIDYDR